MTDEERERRREVIRVVRRNFDDVYDYDIASNMWREKRRHRARKIRERNEHVRSSRA